MHALIALLTRWLPPTIHPMVVHFPIALLWLTALVDVLAVFGGRGKTDRFLDRAGFWLLTLSGAAIVAAGAAGVISEHAAHPSPATRSLLSAHQRDAVLTGFFALIAWLLQIWTRFKGGGIGWTVPIFAGGRVSLWVLIFVLAATVMVSITGSIGGSMVYDHCLGIAGCG